MNFVLEIALYLYILFSIWFVIYVKMNSDKKKGWLRPLIFVLLLPTWDVLIAFIIYIPSALFWSGDAIYEKVKTDTIYYDVYNRKIGVISSTKTSFFYKGVNYVEMRIKEESPYVPPKGLYRYWLDKDKKLKYKKISEIGARYTIQEKKPIDFVIIPISFEKVDIIDRQENKLTASGKSVLVSYLSFFKVPFFNWLRWYDQGKIFIYSNVDFYRIHRRVINSD